MRLFVEPTYFLHSEYVQSTVRESPKTWRNVAYALVGWFDFLTASGVEDWREASTIEWTAYRDALLGSISPHTRENYAKGTVAERMRIVVFFYGFAQEKGLYSGDLAVGSVLTDLHVPFASLSLAHVQRRVRRRRLADKIPKRKPKRSPARPFTISEWRQVIRALGPKPSEQSKKDRRPSRDRLIAETGAKVGLRVEEVGRVTRYQIQSRVPDPNAPFSTQPLTILGKNNVERTVAVPNWLWQELGAYVEGERAAAVKAGGIADPAALFVSGETSNQPGRPLSLRRYEQIIEGACQRAGIVDKKPKTDLETGAIVEVETPRHCFHDLRHTYAVWTYWVEVQSGNAEPWKKIQAQLGHATVITTEKYYLRYVEIFSDGASGRNVDGVLGV